MFNKIYIYFDYVVGKLVQLKLFSLKYKMKKYGAEAGKRLGIHGTGVVFITCSKV